MSMIEIPDGDRTPIHFESMEIVAIRDAGKNKTWIFLRGEDDGWKVECPIGKVLSKIPMRFSNGHMGYHNRRTGEQRQIRSDRSRQR